MSALGSRALGAVLWRPTARPAAVPSRRGLLIEAKQPEKQPPRRKGGDPGQVRAAVAVGLLRWRRLPDIWLVDRDRAADSIPTPPPPLPVLMQVAPSQKSSRAFGAAPVPPPSERRRSGSLADLQLTQPVPWQPPALWDLQVAVGRAKGRASTSEAAALLARLAAVQLRTDVDLEPMRRRVMWLLRQQHPAVDNPPVVARSALQALWTYAEWGALYIAWNALALVSHGGEPARGLQRCMACLMRRSTSGPAVPTLTLAQCCSMPQPHMAFLARAAGEPGLTQQQADEIVEHLSAYEQHLAVAAELWARSFTDLRSSSEFLVYASAGPLLQSLCEALIKLPQVRRQRLCLSCTCQQFACAGPRATPSGFPLLRPP